MTHDSHSDDARTRERIEGDTLIEPSAEGTTGYTDEHRSTLGRTPLKPERERYKGFPRSGELTSVFPLDDHRWGIRYVCGEDTYAAYIHPDQRGTFAVGAQISIDWFKDADFAVITVQR